jgi:hypothetical protein
MPMRWRWPPENSCGKAAGKLGQEAHLQQGCLHLAPPVGLVLKSLKVVQTLADYVVDLGPLVQGGHGILEDHLYLLPQQALGLLGYPA